MTSSRSDHLAALDGLRGCAALSVVFAHCAAVFSDCTQLHSAERSVIELIKWPGHPAVVLFFTLSGFVLFLSFAKTPEMRFGTYILRRLFRIYPAFLASLAAALVLHTFQHPVVPPGMGGWTAAYWGNIDVSAASVIRQVLLLGVFESDRGLDPVLWSLVLELRFSLLLIPLALLALRNWWALIVLALASYVLGASFASQLGMSEPFQVGLSATGSVAILLIYLPTFIFGLAAGALFTRTEFRPQAGLPFMLCLAAPIIAKLGHNELVRGFAYTGVVIAAASPGPIARALASPPIAFLGKISYSLYLVHFPLMMTLAYGFGRSVGYGLPMLATPALALIAATAFHYAFERPGIALGKRVLQKFPAAQPQAA